MPDISSVRSYMHDTVDLVVAGTFAEEELAVSINALSNIGIAVRSVKYQLKVSTNLTMFSVDADKPLTLYMQLTSRSKAAICDIDDPDLIWTKHIHIMHAGANVGDNILDLVKRETFPMKAVFGTKLFLSVYAEVTNAIPATLPIVFEVEYSIAKYSTQEVMAMVKENMLVQ
jgi:hypothetical protein